MKVESTNISQFNTQSPQVTESSRGNKDSNELSKVQERSANIKIVQQEAQQAAQVEQAKQAERAQAKKIDLEEVAQKLQEFMGSINTSLQFSVDEEAGRDVIKVVDKESGDLVRQFPSEEVLDVIKSLSRATGTLLDEQV